MTPAELSAYQRDLVARSLLLADTPEDRHGSYPRRKPVAPLVVVVPVSPHVFVIPVVVENEKLL